MLQNPLLTYKSELKSNVLGQRVYNLLDQTFQIPNDFQYNVIEVTEELDEIKECVNNHNAVAYFFQPNTL